KVFRHWIVRPAPQIMRDTGSVGEDRPAHQRECLSVHVQRPLATGNELDTDVWKIVARDVIVARASLAAAADDVETFGPRGIEPQVKALRFADLPREECGLSART